VENKVLCSRGLLTLHMDRAKLQWKCSDVPGSNSCHVCGPNNEIAVFAQKALLTIPSNTARLGFCACNTVNDNASGVTVVPPTTSSNTPELGFSTVNSIPADASPPSDDYGSDVFTPSMAEAMDKIEHSFTRTITSSQPHSTLGKLTPVTPMQNR
jgi:hypothetical protein